MKTFILIADGSRARLLVHSTEQPSLQEMESFDNESGRASSAEVVTDDAGRNHGSTMVPHTDPQRHSHEQFAHWLAAVLKERLSGYDQLVVVAAPKTLGELRQQLDGAVKAKVVSEINKDLTHVSLHDLTPHLEGVVEIQGYTGRV